MGRRRAMLRDMQWGLGKPKMADPQKIDLWRSGRIGRPNRPLCVKCTFPHRAVCLLLKSAFLAHTNHHQAGLLLDHVRALSVFTLCFLISHLPRSFSPNHLRVPTGSSQVALAWSTWFWRSDEMLAILNATSITGTWWISSTCLQTQDWNCLGVGRSKPIIRERWGQSVYRTFRQTLWLTNADVEEREGKTMEKDAYMSRRFNISPRGKHR